ncbi:hypothetical protein ABEV34_11825 [Methylorubrum rhodesianum]|uniref:hypothetical protein n=1 Tax=Methylorubrum TaxID=2282523 RepID=UPI0016166C0C|nr:MULTISPECIES: hypothetical protein [Methylorubrum]MBB5765721.1 hypothetical protein [Methylorubrum rhodesianum]MBI1691511.1 hypothetical protein [Methylorubrum sp. DB1722]
MKRFLAPVLALMALGAPALAQTRALPPGEIRANGDITFGNTLKLGRREGTKTVITPDTLQILGSGSTGDVSAMTARRSGTGAVPRPLSDRDTRSVKDYGAKLDGSDDTAAFSQARSQTAAGGTIEVPEGRFNALAGGGPATPILWRLQGNTYDGATPVVSIGKDTVETTLHGRKYFGVGATNPDEAPVLRVDQTVTHSGGTGGAVVNALKINQTLGAASLDNYGWAFNATLSSKAYGTGQHTASSALAVRPPDALSDGKGQRATIWADYKEATSQTGQPSNLDGPLVIGEWDMYANGADPGGIRLGLHMLFSRYNPAGAAMGINSAIGIGTNDTGSILSRSYARKILNNELSFTEAGIDFSQATAIGGAPVLRMAAGQDIAWEGSGSRVTRWVDGFWQTRVGGIEIHRLTDSGETGQLGRAQFPYFNAPDRTAPANTADAIGTVGDVIFSGTFMYRKTSSGWLRVQMSTF